MMIIDVSIDSHGLGSEIELIHSIYVANVGPVKEKPHLRMYHCWLDIDPRQNPRPKVQEYVVHKRENGAIELTRRVVQAFTKNKKLAMESK